MKIPIRLPACHNRLMLAFITLQSRRGKISCFNTSCSPLLEHFR
jgi:hypothetical protein